MKKGRRFTPKPQSIIFSFMMDSSQILTRTVEALSTATALNQVTKIVADAARQISGAEGATFVLRDEGQCYYVDEDAISPLWKGKRFPMEICISGWCMLHREVVVIPDIYKDERVPQDAYRPTFVKSLCMVPIRPDYPVGAIGSYWSKEYRPSAEQIKLLQILANSSATALENLELKETLAKRNIEREDFNRRNKDFEFQLNSMAHDLKSPLTTMMGMAELLQLRLRDSNDEKVQRYTSVILNVGDRLNRQINKMLSLYRLSNSTIRKQSVNLSDVAHGLVEGIKTQDPKRAYDISVAPGMEVMADPDLIQLALENLVSNAFKYSSRKDTTWIRIGKAGDSGNLREFVVEDRGAGFDPVHADKLFQPLKRLHQDSEFPGTGLGLASVARIIELHGGTVRAEGKPSEGAKFYFTLPV